MVQAFWEPTPYKVTCGSCRTDLKISMPGLDFILPCTVVLFLGVLAAAGLLFLLKKFVLAAAVGVGAFVMLFCLEFVYGLFIFTYATFTPKQIVYVEEIEEYEEEEDDIYELDERDVYD